MGLGSRMPGARWPRRGRPPAEQTGMTLLGPDETPGRSGLVPVERGVEVAPGQVVRCEGCGQLLGHADRADRAWRVAAATPGEDSATWRLASEAACCFGCVLDRRAALGMPIRRRLGLPRLDDYFTLRPEDRDLSWGRLVMQAREWWRPAAPERPWVTVRTVPRAGSDGYEFEAWWHVGDPDDPAAGDPPLIEIRGCSPGGPGGDTIVLGPVASAAWWLVEGFGPEDAARWTRLGEAGPMRAASLLSWFRHSFAPAFPDGGLVSVVEGREQLTAAGAGVFTWLRGHGAHASSAPASLVTRSRGWSLEEFRVNLDAWAGFVRRWETAPGRRYDLALSWMSRFELHEAQAWCDAGFTAPWDAREWRDFAGLAPGAAVVWHAAGFGADAAAEWTRAGLTLADALDAGADPLNRTGPRAVEVLYARWDEHPFRTLPARLRQWRKEWREYGYGPRRWLVDRLRAMCS